MPISYAALKAEIKNDNPRYERFTTSSLHDLDAMVRSGGYTVNSLAAEMMRIPESKWVEYAGTRAYLLAQLPLLGPLIPAQIARFKTTSLTKNAVGLEHRFTFTSAQGSGMDNNLGGIRTRELVQWPAPPAALANYLLKNAQEYHAAGQHHGLVEGQAMWPEHQDVHNATAAFDAETASTYTGPPLALVFTQTYEFKFNDTWYTVPFSACVMTRTLFSKNRRGVVTLRKTTETGQDVTSAAMSFP